MKAILLIGGFGTRLRPFTLATPKPLLPLLNRPFLQYQFDHLRRHGIRDILLCTAYRPDAFRRVFGSGRSYGVRLRYVHERVPLGTGGAIRNAAPWIDGPALILNGDILMGLDLSRLIEWHRRKKSAITIALTRVQDPTAYGLVETEAGGRIVRFLEKPAPDQVTCDTINAGAYIFERKAFDWMPPAGTPFSVERNFFPKVLDTGEPLYAAVMPGYWMDMGTVAKYRQAHADLLQGRFPADIPGRRVSRNVWLGRQVRVGRQVTLKGPVLIGERCVINDSAVITGPTVLGPGCRIGKGAVLRQSLLMDHVTVEENATLDQAVLGPQVVIGAHASLPPGSALGQRSRIAPYSHV